MYGTVKKIVFKRLALPITGSPDVQGRSSSQGVVSPPKYGLCRIRIRMYGTVKLEQGLVPAHSDLPVGSLHVHKPFCRAPGMTWQEEGNCSFFGPFKSR